MLFRSPSSFTSTSSPRAGTLRPGNSRSSFQKRFARASDHYDRAWQRLQHNLIAAKTSLCTNCPRESADDRALLSSFLLGSEKTRTQKEGRTWQTRCMTFTLSRISSRYGRTPTPIFRSCNMPKRSAQSCSRKKISHQAMNFIACRDRKVVLSITV